MNRRIARAVYRACTIPGADAPFDRAHLKIYYPAVPDEGEEQMNMGVVPVDSEGAPFPVVLILPGINIGPEAYGWLARRLACEGMVVVTFSHVAEEMPGYKSLTPGLDLGAIRPDTFGTRPSATAIGGIVEALDAENAEGQFKDAIDLDRIMLLGHSGGGSVAIFNARPDWFPGVRGAIAYGAHSGASTMLGFEENTILPLPEAVPILLLAGSRDGVIAGSAHRYGGESDRVADTFERGVARDSGDSYLVEVDGANHFSVASPVDESTGRSFLDETESGDGDAIRDLIFKLVLAFTRDAFEQTQERMQAFRDHDLVTRFHQR